MEAALTGFIRALRMAGAPVSPAEAIDAARTLAIIGVSDRDVMKESLAAVLAKSVEEKAIHDGVFDDYFARADVETEDTPQPEDQSADDPEAEDEGGASGEDGEAQQAGGEDDFLSLANSTDAARIALALERAAAAADVESMRFSMQTGPVARRMLEALGVRAMEAEILRRFEAGGPENTAAAEAMIAARARLQARARAYIEQRFEAVGRFATEAFMEEVVSERAMDAMSLRDMARLKPIVARLAKRLAERHALRMRRRRRGRLDVRRTLTKSAATDGVPFDLVWRRKKRDRPKIVAVCDVSGSVARSVRFLLMFLYALAEETADVQSFAFSARLGEVTSLLAEHEFEAAFDLILRAHGGGSTDYGAALEDLDAGFSSLIDRRTTVIILGDGRSNRGNPRLDLFRALAAQAKRVVWLCNEPPAMWGTGDSCMLEYRPLCSSVSHCATVLDLERVLDNALAAYG